MSNPSDWTDRVLEHLSLVYGQRFLRQWQGMDPDKVRLMWHRQLMPLTPRAIEYGLMHLPALPINAIEFKAICLGTPPAPAPRELPAPRADLERLRETLQALKAPRQRDPREWAWKLKAREEAGERLTLAQRTMWRTALAPYGGATELYKSRT